ncbi:DUF3168 domain-containing protein [Shinella curvata]|uniref:DUF3168 domain-containing protein n=1 Tax=Shinella curvata TaxID=1817964 RepID=A0ABT8XGV3_9HYPH|nr:DUF3168 domain-containing protein [Shinella curvata]MCJ8053357.1 DUF3168 domain-containing protein [Shinella curvata]MDO6122688.1 DUF3168 domain-containing protein [Shinella curvata]
MSAAGALQKAIYERLSGDTALTALLGGNAVTDRRLDAPVAPLVVVAGIVSSDHSTATEPGEEHMVTLDIWSDAAGHRQAQAIAAAVRSLLHDAALVLAGYRLVLLFHRETRLSRDGKTRFHHAEMQFRAVTEPAT